MAMRPVEYTLVGWVGLCAWYINVRGIFPLETMTVSDYGFHPLDEFPMQSRVGYGRMFLYFEGELLW